MKKATPILVLIFAIGLVSAGKADRKEPPIKSDCTCDPPTNPVLNCAFQAERAGNNTLKDTGNSDAADAVYQVVLETCLGNNL